jgi:hypothetical protein
MAMIKKGKTGHIEESYNPEVDHKDQPNIEWSNEVVIKDILEVPTTSVSVIDVDLDEEDNDEIAVRV